MFKGCNMVTDYPNWEVEIMTVCVAAICENNNTILGASDRMLTAGNVQFQPPASKTYQLTTAIVAMVAGEMTIQAEIISGLQSRINALIGQDPPPDWLNVKDVALMYAELYNAIKARRGENDILIPLGLTLDTFISRQRELAPELVSSIATELIGKSLPGTGAIVTGVDRTGAHIFVVDNGKVSCHDAAGFAAIGAGWYHASSHLMFSRHGKNGTLSRTLLLTYTAKKRAEVAPGVGVVTDMFAVRGLGNYFVIGDHVIQEFQKRYDKAVVGHAKVESIAERKADEYIKEITKPAEQPGQTEQQIAHPTSPVNEAASPVEVR